MLAETVAEWQEEWKREGLEKGRDGRPVRKAGNSGVSISF